MNTHYRICLLSILGLLLTHFSSHSQEQFSGKWKINAEQSDFGGLAAAIAAPVNIEVTITDSVLIFRTFDGRPSSREALVLGAKAVETFPDGNTLKKSKVIWLKEQKNILFSWYYEVGGNEWHYTRTETWALSEDRKILTIDRVTVLPEKTDRVKAIYQRL